MLCIWKVRVAWMLSWLAWHTHGSCGSSKFTDAGLAWDTQFFNLFLQLSNKGEWSPALIPPSSSPNQITFPCEINEPVWGVWSVRSLRFTARRWFSCLSALPPTWPRRLRPLQAAHRGNQSSASQRQPSQTAPCRTSARLPDDSSPASPSSLPHLLPGRVCPAVPPLHALTGRSV